MVSLSSKERPFGVVFFGRADKNQVRQLHKGSELSILPSRREPFGIVLLEAMACGRAIVATSSGGPQEIIEDGVNGVLVAPNNSKELACTILKLLKDENLRKTLCAKALERVREFNVSKMGHSYEEVFR